MWSEGGGNHVSLSRGTAFKRMNQDRTRIDQTAAQQPDCELESFEHPEITSNRLRVITKPLPIKSLLSSFFSSRAVGNSGAFSTLLGLGLANLASREPERSPGVALLFAISIFTVT